jgi:hypothetical protein
VVKTVRLVIDNNLGSIAPLPGPAKICHVYHSDGRSIFSKSTEAVIPFQVTVISVGDGNDTSRAVGVPLEQMSHVNVGVYGVARVLGVKMKVNSTATITKNFFR